MHYIRIKNHIIDLKEICHAYPYLDRLVIAFKNGTNTEIIFNEYEKKRLRIELFVARSH